jgi:hypothetical protein
MKKILIFALSSIFLFSCGGANDGNANTDTTSMPVDTSVQNTISTDTAGYINTPTGKVSLDSNAGRKTTGAASKKATKKDSGKTPRHDPNGKDTTRF